MKKKMFTVFRCDPEKSSWPLGLDLPSPDWSKQFSSYVMNDSNNYTGGFPPRSTWSVSKNNSAFWEKSWAFPDLPLQFVTQIKNGVSEDGKGEGRDEKKEEDKVCIFERAFSTGKRRKRNKKMVSSSPLGSFWWSRICSPVDAEGLCPGGGGGYMDTILLVHMSFCVGVRCFAFKAQLSNWT